MNQQAQTFSPIGKDKPSSPVADSGANVAPKNMDSEPAGMFHYEYDSENSGVRLTCYLGDKTQLKIPDEIDGNPVIGIDGDCFEVGSVTDVYYSDQLKYFEWGYNWSAELGNEFIIPYGVTRIGSMLYDSATKKKLVKNIMEVTIPNTVTEIGPYTFYGFESLRDVVIPDSVTVMGLGAFQGCSSLTSLTIPGNVTAIGSDAFRGCELLPEQIKNRINEIESSVEGLSSKGTVMGSVDIDWINKEKAHEKDFQSC